MPQVKIIAGTVRGRPIENEIFFSKSPIVTDADGTAFIDVANLNRFEDLGTKVRVRMRSADCAEILQRRVSSNMTNTSLSQPVKVPTVTSTETDDQAMDRIGKRFSILDQMTKATINGDIKAMIVSGPPGVGKSHGVETQLEKSSLFDKLAGSKIRYEVVKGAMTALGLYAQLYKFSDPKNVLVFDDCDSVFFDELSLNILKAALDSGKHRRIFWNSDSNMLRREGVPSSFDFRGSVIFITNIDFANVKSKKLQDHLDALQSRCHYLDLTINSERDKMLRVRQVHRDVGKSTIGGLFADYEFDGDEGEQVLNYMWENRANLREISLRMALKIADLVKVSPGNWQDLAAITVCKS